MYIGETQSIIFEIDQALGINLTSALEVEIKCANNGTVIKTFLKSNASPNNVVISGTGGLIATANLQRNDSLTLKPGNMLVQLRVKMPTSLYPAFPQDGMHLIAQGNISILKSI
jgi:hypothetical protein